MAEDLGLNIPAAASLTTVAGLFGSDITAGNSDTSTGDDISGAPVASELSFEITLVFNSGTVDGVAVVKIKWAADDGTGYTDDDEADHVATITPVASTTIHKVVNVPVKDNDFQILVDNDQTSGPSIDTTSTIKFKEIHGDQA